MQARVIFDIYFEDPQRDRQFWFLFLVLALTVDVIY